MIEPDNKNISMRRQCSILAVNRGNLYYHPVEKIEDAELKSKIFALWKKNPFFGYRRISKTLQRENLSAGEYQVRLFMKEMQLSAIYPKKNLSVPCLAHKKYPYLLKDLEITGANLVWATDITYVKVSGSTAYIIAIIDLYSRKVLSWRISNTMDADFCLDALNEALILYGAPHIFNTDQGSQFTSEGFLNKLRSNHIRISMDGKGRAIDNIYVERLWRSLKYENVYLNDYRNLAELKKGVGEYFRFFNSERLHQSLRYKTPDEVYDEASSKLMEKIV